MRDFQKWKRVAANFATVAIFIVLFLRAPWMDEYAAHREAVLSVSGTSLRSDSGSPSDVGSKTGSSAATVSDGVPSSRTRFVPDPVAEAAETVITGPDPEISKRLLTLIRSAKTELLLNVYLLTDPSVTDELVAAKKR